MSAVHDSDGWLSAAALQHVWDMQAIVSHAVTLHDFLTMQCRRWRISPPMQLQNECSPDAIAHLMTRLEQLQRQMESPAWRAALSSSSSSSSASTTFLPMARPIFRRSLYNLGNSCWFNASFVVLSHMLFELHGKAPWVGSAVVDDTWRKLIKFCESPPNVAIRQESKTIRDMLRFLDNEIPAGPLGFTFSTTQQVDASEAILPIVEHKVGATETVLYHATAFSAFSLLSCNQCSGGKSETVQLLQSLFEHGQRTMEGMPHILYLPFPVVGRMAAGGLHLKEMLQSYFDAEVVPGYRCPIHPTDHIGASRVLKLASAPECLVIQLQRNRFDKIVRTPVDIPDDLSIDYYPTFTFNNRKTYWYRLMAAVIHLHGDASGHYVVMVRRTVNNVQQWVYFDDDAIVRTMNDSEVFRVRKSAYLLVYKRKISATLVFPSSSSVRPPYHIQTRTSVANGRSSRSSSAANAAAASSSAVPSVSGAVIELD